MCGNSFPVDILIDFASCACGVAAADVVMFIEKCHQMNVNMNSWSWTFFPSVVFSLFFHFVRHFIDFQPLNMHTTVRNNHLVLFINREMCGNNVKTELPAYPNVTLLKDSKMANISKYRCIHQMQRHLYQFSACT